MFYLHLRESCDQQPDFLSPCLSSLLPHIPSICKLSFPILLFCRLYLYSPTVADSKFQGSVFFHISSDNKRICFPKKKESASHKEHMESNLTDIVWPEQGHVTQ